MTNRSHKLAMVEFNDMVFWVDPDELKLTYDYRHLALSFVPLAVVIAMAGHGVMDACLQGVHEEDRPVIRNVVAAIEHLKKEKLFTSWTCSMAKGHYTVTAYIGDGDWELGSRELEAIHEVNPLRIVSVSVQSHGGRAAVRVRVSDRNEPLMMTETQIVHLRKRSRWMAA